MPSGSDIHRELQMKLNLTETATPINTLLSRIDKEYRVTANKQLVVVIRALQLLSRQNIALRNNVGEVGVLASNTSTD